MHKVVVVVIKPDRSSRPVRFKPRPCASLPGIVSELEAIIIAVKESFERLSGPVSPVDFSQWLGSAKWAPENSQPRFQSDDAL